MMRANQKRIIGLATAGVLVVGAAVVGTVQGLSRDDKAEHGKRAAAAQDHGRKGMQGSKGERGKAGNRASDRQAGRDRAASIPGGFGGDVLHGDVVVYGQDGFDTRRVQSGEITAVTGTSVKVRSEDGHEITWTVTDSTKGRPTAQMTEPGPTVAKQCSAARSAKKAPAGVGSTVRVVGTVVDDTSLAEAFVVVPDPEKARAKALERREQRFGDGEDKPTRDAKKPAVEERC